MQSRWAERAGTVVRGHRVASGKAGDPRFPDGTVALQLPLFRDRLPDLDAWLGGPPWPGTVNVALPGMQAGPAVPDATLAAVRWTDVFAPETFFLSRAEMVHRGTAYRAWLYISDPATKPADHPPRADVVELLARPVAGLAYGDTVMLRYDPRTLHVTAR